MKCLLKIIFLLLICKVSDAQQGFAFSHITTDDGTGLASNLVTSLYQDEKGFIWVGTANGLQRFDGSKFIDISTSRQGSDYLQHYRISQIIPGDSGKLVLASFSLAEFGIFDPATFLYKKIPLKPLRKILPGSEYRLWKDSKGEIYLNVQSYGILHYSKARNAFVDDIPFPFPPGWKVNVLGVYENLSEQQYWFGSNNGLCIYDVRSKQMWYRDHNPRNLAILKNERVQDGVHQIYIDKQKRIWLFCWPSWGNGVQYKFCLDSTGSRFLQKDTAGLNNSTTGLEYKFFYETREGDLWIYGFNVLFNYDKSINRFQYNKSSPANNNISINYESVFQVIEDKENNIWIATNEGIYYTATGSANMSVVNLTFSDKSGPTSINDILELPNGDLWFTSFRAGINSIDKSFKKIDNYVYSTPPPASWPATLKAAALQTISLCREAETGTIWIGCLQGVLLIHDPIQKTTRYVTAPEFNNSNIKFITEDKKKQMWLGTQDGKLIKYDGNRFTEVHNVGTIIYKVFIDNEGWIWLATRDRGLFAISAEDGRVLQHYTTDNGKNSLYSNTGTDIEQLQNGLIAFGAGALHFINKKTGGVTVVKYEDGLPSNTVARLRLDNKGFLWIITSNGLSRYNPGNHRITPYGRKDGVVLAEQTIAADFRTRDGNIIFGGSNSMIMINPAFFANSQPPPQVTITDFKIFNQYLPVDSLLRNTQIKLGYDQNSLSIYFASLSFRDRDKLTYYYKMEGIDKDWVKADRSYYVNYSLLPPGNYTFKIYCENIEGKRSQNITELSVFIKPPFYMTWWFISSLLFVVAVLIYAVHDLRVNRLLAVETLRNRVARDLHDDMGSTLSTINILSSMAKNKMYADTAKTSEYITKISEYSERMMDAMDDIVWSIKPSNDSMQKITARMREFATNVLEAKEIDFEFKAEEELHDIKLNMEARRDFFLVFKEAVNNAAKYSQASKVLIEVTLHNKRLSLIVKDDGVGFDPAEADGNGLGNMQKRAENLNGVVTIQTRKGEGTTVKVVIPFL